MAARRYEISLRVLKNISRVSAANEWNIFNTTREISYLQAAMLCSIYYINTNEIPYHFTETVFSSERRNLLCSHSNGDIFTCESNMLFPRVKISCFRAKAHLVFHWCAKIIYDTHHKLSYWEQLPALFSKLSLFMTRESTWNDWREFSSFEFHLFLISLI